MTKNKNNNKLTKEDEVKIEICSLICETIEDEILPIVDDFYKEYDDSSLIGKIRLLKEKRTIDNLDNICCFLFNAFSTKRFLLKKMKLQKKWKSIC